MKSKNTAMSSYVCSNCGTTEEIPIDVLEYFDEISPEQLIFGGHQFKCENCNTGIMKSVNEEKPIIRGFGLFEGFKGF